MSNEITALDIAQANRRHDHYYGFKLDSTGLYCGTRWKSHACPAAPHPRSRESIWEWHRRLDQEKFALQGLSPHDRLPT